MSLQGEQEALEIIRKTEQKLFWAKVIIMVTLSIITMIFALSTILKAIDRATEKAVTDAVAQNDVIYCLIVADNQGKEITEETIDKCKEDVQKKIEKQEKSKSSNQSNSPLIQFGEAVSTPFAPVTTSESPQDNSSKPDKPDDTPPPEEEPDPVSEIIERVNELGQKECKVVGDTVWFLC